MATQLATHFFFLYFNPPVQLREPLYKKHISFFLLQMSKIRPHTQLNLTLRKTLHKPHQNSMIS